MNAFLFVHYDKLYNAKDNYYCFQHSGGCFAIMMVGGLVVAPVMADQQADAIKFCKIIKKMLKKTFGGSSGGLWLWLWLWNLRLT
jgi:hypothetical protein